MLSTNLRRRSALPLRIHVAHQRRVNIYVIAYVAERCSIASFPFILPVGLLPHVSLFFCAHVFFTAAAPFNFGLCLNSQTLHSLNHDINLRRPFHQQIYREPPS